MAPQQNRVTPLGDIEAFALRGAWTGNRGVLHSGHEIVRFHAGNLWITCALAFRGRWRELWLPNRWTPLFFHDEAVSMAAGHRPCGECRHASYQDYKRAWARTHGGQPPSAGEMNRQLHGERIFRGTHRRRLHRLLWRDLPDGTFVFDDGELALVLGECLVVWTREGYSATRALPRTGTAAVITPPSSVDVLRAGYSVQIDESARELAGLSG
ncbi:hypothetical protein [Pseudonocardia acaciae]|uniref:hypothetical protein n=1 Tax=Pseudonocardia acaciae TaxID=551276 RepID=UPI00056CADAF|nr:hypothetical protein [Pseudonocardia acaciae]